MNQMCERWDFLDERRDLMYKRKNFSSFHLKTTCLNYAVTGINAEG